MATREFKLPGVQDLSKEQEAARALPKDGQHLIVGGPGTGKSVLALLRSRRHHQDSDDYMFLVYNHLLHRASSQLFGGGLKNSTWERWFRQMYSVPLGPQRSNGYRPIDWVAVGRKMADVRGVSAATPRPYLVIDEGQDMPPQLYEALIQMGFENFFVVADQNQQITEANSSRQQLQDVLAIDAKDVIELDLNYRNRYAIARLAREFYTNDPASPPPSLPKEAGDRRLVPVLYTYQHTDLPQVAACILRHAYSDPHRLVGVLSPNNRVRESYLKALKETPVTLDNSRPRIETYSSGSSAHNVTFEKGGILVINAQSCKGLEFDTAILADVDEHYYDASDPDATKRLFYVMVARAIDRVFLFRKAGNARIDEILPDDPNVMRREEL